MRVSCEGQFLLDTKKTGIGWLTDNIISELAKYDDIEFNINCFAYRNKEEIMRRFKRYTDIGIGIHPLTWCPSRLYKGVSALIPVPYSFFYGRKDDVFISFNYYLPPGAHGKNIVFMHDMSFYAHPEYTEKENLAWLKLNIPKSVRRADKIFTISEFSKREIIKYLGVDPAKITVVPCGTDTSLYRTGYTQEQIEASKKKYSIPEKYILYLGTIEPRKNIAMMFRAYAKAVESDPTIPALVLAGRKGWKDEEIYAVLEKLKLGDRVIMTGYVDQEDSPRIISGAEYFVFPSIYEGFGLPVLEAMSCGTPVITSDAASLPEVIGDCGIKVDPNDEADIANAMITMHQNPNMREKFSADALERAKQFTWAKAAQLLYEGCKELIS